MATKEKETKGSSFIQSAIPLPRGPAKHIESLSDRAVTSFDSQGKVTSITTPQEAFRRVHEVLHARHTNPKDYSGIRDEISQIVEDCRLHSLYWPWDYNRTPDVITYAAIKEIDEDVETALASTSLSEFGKFAAVLRGNAVRDGLCLDTKFFQATHPQINLERTVRKLINRGQHNAACVLLEEVFFDSKDDDEEWLDGEDGNKKETSSFMDVADEIKKDAKSKSKKKKKYEDELAKINFRGSMGRRPQMETIELPLVAPTTSEITGFRRATSGPRIYRPALRRPILPQRLFCKYAPVAPGGAILFDASGSMGVNNQVLLDCCLRSPMATIAFYCGDDIDRGWLWIFAQNGQRSDQVPKGYPPGNSVDGPAMDWLMDQGSPRIFVTDRHFCGSSDYEIQIARLEQLERSGDITVYTSYAAFKNEFA